MSRPRLAIGPANYAGQAFAWAEAVNRNLPASAWSFTANRLRHSGYAFDAHRRLSVPQFYLPLLRTARARRFVADATHLILDGFRPVLYDRRPDGFARQARALAERGPTLALLAHGTDVRDPDAHMERMQHSYFREGDAAWLERCRVTTRRNRDTAADLGVPVFVSTPDMLRDLPQATWLPVTLDVDAWHQEAPLLERSRPRVLFVPSQRTPPIKGTRYVDPVLRRLDAAGVIEYVAPTGVPHAQMADLVKSVDVVVDQLLFGSYGVAAIEAMAAGRVVVGNISTLDTTLMPELPHIEHAEPDTLADVITSMVPRADELRTAATENVEFVRRWHDGREAASRLSGFLGLG